MNYPDFNTVGTYSTTPSEHIFNLRRTWTKIRRLQDQTTDVSTTREDRQRTFASQLRAELEAWHSLTPLVAVENDVSTNHLPETMETLYGYSMCLLAQENILVLRVDDLKAVLMASSQACRYFRRIQNARLMVYQTWSAVRNCFIYV